MLQRRLYKFLNPKQFVRNVSVAQPKEDFDRIKAWQVHSYGEDLQLCPVRTPAINKSTELLVKVDAASLNPIDVAMKDGYGRTIMKIFRCQDLVLPMTLGRDFSGTVINKGMDVGKEFNIGDKVYGVVPFNMQGTHADQVVVNKNHICRKPNDLSTVEAASVPYAALTAWSALWLTGGLMFHRIQGMKVLILGASGGVGTCAVQMLKSSGATVVATCSLDAAPLVQSLGADCVLDYRDPSYLQNVAAQGKYDIILDCAQFGHQSVPSSWSYKSFITLNSPLLRNTDSYGLIGGFAYSAAELIPPNLMNIRHGKLLKWAYFYPSNDGLNFINKLVSTNQLVPVIDTVFPFEKTPEAYEKAKGGHLRGKIVIDLQNP